MNKAESLQEYVLRVLHEKRLTCAEVERHSGRAISDSYVWHITAGQYRSLTVEKLQALARGLDVPEDEVFAAARGCSNLDQFEHSDFALLYRKYLSLSEQDKQGVDELLNSLRREIEWRQMHPTVSSH